MFTSSPLNSTGTVFALEDQTQLMAIPRYVYLSTLNSTGTVFALEGQTQLMAIPLMFTP